MSDLSPAMRRAIEARQESRPKTLAHQGKIYRAEDPGDWIFVSHRGLVYLHTPNIDVLLNGVEFPRYEHDGRGGVTLHGNLPQPVTMSLDKALARFEHIEAWRERMDSFPGESRKADLCMSSLLKATDAAEKWRVVHGEPG